MMMTNIIILYVNDNDGNYDSKKVTDNEDIKSRKFLGDIIDIDDDDDEFIMIIMYVNDNDGDYDDSNNKKSFTDNEDFKSKIIWEISLIKMMTTNILIIMNYMPMTMMAIMMGIIRKVLLTTNISRAEYFGRYH